MQIDNLADGSKSTVYRFQKRSGDIDAKNDQYDDKLNGSRKADVILNMTHLPGAVTQTEFTENLTPDFFEICDQYKAALIVLLSNPQHQLPQLQELDTIISNDLVLRAGGQYLRFTSRDGSTFIPGPKCRSSTS